MTTQSVGRLTRSEAGRALGTKGLSVWNGIIGEEYLAILKNWRRAADVYREMADDSVIGTLLDAIKAPLLAADFDVAPAGTSDADRRAADFLWETINRMAMQTWRSHVVDMLEALDFGFAIGEVTLEKRGDGRLWLRNIDPRGQETVERWLFDGDAAVGLVQRDPVSGEQRTIPLEKCVHVVFRGRKGNPMGKALLRSVFRPWRFLKNLENLEGIGVERDVGGTPMVEWDADKWQGWSQQQLREIYEDALRGLRNDEEVFLINVPGAKVVPYRGGDKMFDVREVIRDKRKEILQRFFAQFLELGMNRVGAQALVKGSQDFFSLALRGVQQEFLEAWNSRLVPLLLGFNRFQSISSLPQITWADPGKVDARELVEAYGRGASVGVITPLPQDEERLRAALDLPDLPEGAGEDGGDEEQPMRQTGRASQGSVEVDVEPSEDTGMTLNGSQMEVLLAIVEQVTSRRMSPESAKGLITAAFPGIAEAQVNAMVDSAATWEGTPAE